MSDRISLKGLDKAEVFAVLYNGARAQGLGFLQYSPKAMTAEDARQRFGCDFGYFDYVDGRVMKVNLSDDEFDPWLYDRDNGQGAAQKAINVLLGLVDAEEVEMQHLENTRRAAQDAKGELHKITAFNSGVVELGIGDFAEDLRPKLDEILGKDEEEDM